MEFTSLVADAAFDAYVLINDMLAFALAGNTAHRTVSGTERTTYAVVINHERNKILASAGRTFVVLDMSLILFREIGHRGQYRVRRSLAKSAKRRVFDYIGQGFQFDQRILGSVAIADGFQHFVQPGVADPAWSAFAAGFIQRELKEEFGNVNHAVIFVQDDHAAGPHHRAQPDQRFVINRSVYLIRADAAAGRAAGLHGFELLAVLDAVAESENDIFKRSAHRHFHQADFVNFPGQGEHFGSGRIGGTDLLEPG